MLSGNAGLSARISTTMKPISKPNSQRPASVFAADTGSVAMNVISVVHAPGSSTAQRRSRRRTFALTTT